MEANGRFTNQNEPPRTPVASRVASRAAASLTRVDGGGENILRPALLPYAPHYRWVVWKYGPPRKNGKRPKLPYHPNTGDLFAGNGVLVPGAGGTFGDALQALTAGHWRDGEHHRYRQHYDGIGFILGKGVVGVDFDRCVGGGMVAPRVLADVEALGSYAEFSPSGEGVKALVLGELPSNWKADYCEGYATDRFFTITGRQVNGTPDALRPAKEALNTLWETWASRSARAGESPRVAGEPRLSPLALVAADFWDQVSYWERHRARLLRQDDLPYAMSPQLRDLVNHGILPGALAAKGDSASERRALVIRQLRRRGYGYDDAQAYVIARTLWRKLSLETKGERDLITDAIRLILDENPLPLEHTHHRSQERTRACREALSRGELSPATPPVTLEPAAPRRAPVSTDAYLAALIPAAVSGVVVEGRRERAELAGVHPKTAQRLEALLEAEGLIVVKIIRTATGKGTVVQIRKRINGPILADEPPFTEDVHTPPADGITTGENTTANACAIGHDTVCPVVSPVAPERTTELPPTPQPCYLSSLTPLEQSQGEESATLSEALNDELSIAAGQRQLQPCPEPAITPHDADEEAAVEADPARILAYRAQKAQTASPQVSPRSVGFVYETRGEALIKAEHRLMAALPTPPPARRSARQVALPDPELVELAAILEAATRLEPSHLVRNIELFSQELEEGMAQAFG